MLVYVRCVSHVHLTAVGRHLYCDKTITARLAYRLYSYIALSAVCLWCIVIIIHASEGERTEGGGRWERKRDGEMGVRERCQLDADDKLVSSALVAIGFV